MMFALSLDGFMFGIGPTPYHLWFAVSASRGKVLNELVNVVLRLQVRIGRWYWKRDFGKRAWNRA